MDIDRTSKLDVVGVKRWKFSWFLKRLNDDEDNYYGMMFNISNILRGITEKHMHTEKKKIEIR